MIALQGWIGLGVLLSAGAAWAAPAGRALIVGQVGGPRDSYARDPKAWQGLELDDWRDPSQGSSLVVAPACDVLLRYRLIGTRRRNYLMIEARANKATRFDASQIKMRLGDSDVEVHPAFGKRSHWIEDLVAGDEVFAAVPFPDKQSFEGIARVRASVPFGACVAQVEIKRPGGVDARVDSHQIWARMQLGLEIGAGVAKLGNLSNVAKSGVAFGMSVTRYPWIHHGFWLGFKYESMRSSISSIELAIGYSYRRYLGSRFALHYGIAPAVYEIAYAPDSSGYKTLAHNFAIAQRIGVDWLFGRLSDLDPLDSDHGLGLLLTADWLPSARMGGVSASGGALGLLLRYTFGT